MNIFERYEKIGEIKPKTSKEIVDSNFCVGFETLDRDTFDPSRCYEKVGQTGVKWVRVQSGWMKTEKELGVYMFEWLDAIVNGLLEQGVRVWLDLGYSNPLHVPECDHPYGVGFPPIKTESARSAWRRYIFALTEHFMDRIDHYEVWNEPDWAYWTPNGPNPREYGQFTAETARIIKSLQPKAKVALTFASAADTPDSTRYFDIALSFAANDIDFVVYHGYPIKPEESLEEKLIVMKSICDAHKPGIKIIQGESGCQSSAFGFGAGKGLPWTEEIQAKWLLRRMVIDKSKEEIYFSSYFTAVDIPDYPGRNGGAPFCYTGILRGTDYSPKPSFYAFRNLCSLFDFNGSDRHYRASFSNRSAADKDFPFVTSDYCPDTGSLRKVSFNKDGIAMLAYWNPTNMLLGEWYSQASLKVYIPVGASINNPVFLDLLTGNIYVLPEKQYKTDLLGPEHSLFGHTFSREAYVKEGLGGRVHNFAHIPVTDYPIIITDKKLFKL